jgi:CVNH domain
LGGNEKEEAVVKLYTLQKSIKGSPWHIVHSYPFSLFLLLHSSQFFANMKFSLFLTTLPVLVHQAFAASISIRNTTVALGGFTGTCIGNGKYWDIENTSILTASCRDKSGEYVDAQVDLNACMNDNNGVVYVS